MVSSQGDPFTESSETNLDLSTDSTVLLSGTRLASFRVYYKQQSSSAPVAHLAFEVKPGFVLGLELNHEHAS